MNTTLTVAAILAPFFIGAFVVALVLEALDKAITGVEDAAGRVVRMGGKS